MHFSVCVWITSLCVILFGCNYCGTQSNKVTHEVRQEKLLMSTFYYMGKFIKRTDWLSEEQSLSEHSMYVVSTQVNWKKNFTGRKKISFFPFKADFPLVTDLN